MKSFQLIWRLEENLSTESEKFQHLKQLVPNTTCCKSSTKWDVSKQPPEMQVISLGSLVAVCPALSSALSHAATEGIFVP